VNPDSGVTISGNTIIFANAGTYNVLESATNSNSVTASSANSVITVIEGPTITLTPSSSAIDIGQSIKFTNATTGAKPFTYSYKITPSSGVTRTGNAITFANAGTFNVSESVTDTNGITARSTNASITVNAKPTITLIPSSRSVGTGQVVRFGNNTFGGTKPYSFSFTVNNTSGVTISKNNITFAYAGFYNVTEKVTDATGVTAQSAPITLGVTTAFSTSTTTTSSSTSTAASSVSTIQTSSVTVTVPVNNSGANSQSQSSPSGGVWIIAGVIVAIAVIAGAIYLWRMKGSRTHQDGYKKPKE
jgi:hypothetical protein